MNFVRGAGGAISFVAMILVACASRAAEAPPPPVADAVKDAFTPAEIGAAHFDGYLGQRITVNTDQRLLTIDLDSILEPYVHRPGPHAWAGEHAGKFLHAATLDWQRTGDARVKERMDRVAQALIKSQLPDGYLGTYSDEKRWTSWDVWSHKYNLIGLLTYYRATGDAASLDACRKVGDLLCKTFGDDSPQKRDILKSGTHLGMAATSVLEPMVMLYRCTGEKRYLDFCQYLVRSWDEYEVGKSPRILSTLLAGGGVRSVANAKAYEMMSNLVGLLDLYRVTGDASYRKACDAAWKDIVAHQNYATGTSSWSEHFQQEDLLRPDGAQERNHYVAAGEGCVTVTWLQMNWHLLRLTGDAAYGDQLERTTYNALLAQESPLDGNVCYFLPMLGRKRFNEVTHGIPNVSCCSSSIPRGIAMIPAYATGAINGDPAVILYAPGEQTIDAAGDMRLKLKIETDYPKSGTIDIKLLDGAKGEFPLLLRVPAWCDRFEAKAGDQTQRGTPGQFLSIRRAWKNGDAVHVEMNLPMMSVAQGPGYVAIERGPQVLAHDDSIASDATTLPAGWSGTQIYSVRGTQNGQPTTMTLVPIADAGQQHKAEFEAVFSGFKLAAVASEARAATNAP